MAKNAVAKNWSGLVDINGKRYSNNSGPPDEGGSSANLLFSDDMASYTVGDSASTIFSKMSTKGWEPDFNQGYVTCEMDPQNGTQKCVTMEYRGNDDNDHWSYYPLITNLQKACMVWDEWVNSTFFFATAKAFLMIAAANSSTGPGSLTGQPTCQTYVTVGTEIGDNTGECSVAGINNQGVNSYGNGADVVLDDYVMPRVQKVTFKFFVEQNDNGVGNATTWLKANDVVIASRTGFQLGINGNNYIKRLQQGFTSSYGPGYPRLTKRYLANFFIYDGDPDA